MQANAQHLDGIEACVFDAYGTLFDYASAVERCRDAIGPEFARFNDLWRQKQLQYTWLRAAQGRHADFWQVTGDALDFSLETAGIATPELRERLMSLYLRLDVFPEVPEVLRELKARGLKTAILSNGSPAMLSAVVANAGLGASLDAVLSVEEVGAFKPDPRVYALAMQRLGVSAGAISFQSSNAWDAHAASAAGMRVVWCNRYGQRPERLPGKPDIEVRTLATLPDIVAARR
jgi:2-haloacid dehalogenase